MGSEIKGPCKVGWVCGRDSEQAWRVYAASGLYELPDRLDRINALSKLTNQAESWLE